MIQASVNKVMCLKDNENELESPHPSSATAHLAVSTALRLEDQLLAEVHQLLVARQGGARVVGRMTNARDGDGSRGQDIGCRAWMRGF